MKKHLLMAGAVVAALAIPLAANAQSPSHKFIKDYRVFAA